MKKTLAILLSVSCLLSLAACETEEKTEQAAETASSYISLEEFDSYDSVNKIWFKNTLGDARLSNDETYISSGENSLQVTVADEARYKDQKHETSFYVPTQTANGDYSDFSMIDEVSLDVYGVSGSDLKVSLGLILRSAAVVASPSKTFDIQAGEWTTVTFPVNRTVVDTCFSVKTVSHVDLSVQGVNAVVCVDNMRLHRAVNDFAPAEFYLDENEICDFEKPYQEFAFVPKMAGGVTPTAVINTDPDYATSGLRSLKVSSPAMDSNVWFNLEFSKNLFAAAEFSKRSSTSYIAIDVYKPFERTWYTTVRFRNLDSGAYENVDTTMPTGIGWHTVCISLSRTAIGTSSMEFNWQSQAGLPDGGVNGVEFYLDNLRIVDELPKNCSLVCVE
ncbi:MAG: hypothetical protein IJ317_04935 [Clostridia bacterium]|nr:hypothetical protein [Clostridia bacterium]